MKHSREHIETYIVARLQKRKEGDRDVTPLQFKQVADRLDIVIYRVLEEVTIPSFTDDDLVSFMLMKTHRMMREDKVDMDRKDWHSMFHTAFLNLMRDIVRMQESADRRGMWLDPIDEKADNHIDEEKASWMLVNV